MNDTYAEAFHTLIIKVASTVARDFPFLDTEDMIQDLWEELMGSYQDELTPWSPGLRRYLASRAGALAWSIRKEQLRMLSEYTYRLPDVREIMETVFDREDWPAGYTPQDAKAGERDRMAAVEVRIDAIYAYRELNQDDREVLISRYHDKVIPKRGSAEELQLWRALNNLTEVMNGY